MKPGDTLGNKYRVDALIGRGGMGHVFAATDLTGPAPPVAIKVVSRLMFDETLMARLRREAEAAARIRSDYVPRVLEVSDTDDREMFLVMERLVGEPLSQRMRDKGPMAWSDVLQFGEDVLRGLIDAHTAGVVHRDLKPSNVFLALKGGRIRAMVLDFGVCKMDSVDTEHLTGTGESIGTVAYMAPEQIRGASKVDDRADLYAFGVLVFEMLCGRLPHDGPSQMAILASKLENDPARLRDCSRVAVPEGLDALVGKALVRDPQQRFTSAQELLKAWRKLGSPDLTTAPSAGTASMIAAAAGSRAAGTKRHDPHDAPTLVTIGEHEHTVHGGSASIPVEAHPTQTALTQGISLRKGGNGRVAFALAAFALVAGVVSVAAFFARGPDASGPGVNAGAGVSAAAAAGAGAGAGVGAGDDGGVVSGALGSAAGIGDAGTSSEPAEQGFELDEGNGAAAVTTSAKRPVQRVRRTSAPAPKASGPHITSQPRY